MYVTFGEKFNANLNAFMDPAVEDLKKQNQGAVAEIVGVMVAVPMLLLISIPLAIVKTVLQSSLEAALYIVPVAAGHLKLFATWEAPWSRAMSYLGSASLPVLFVGMPLYVANNGDLSGWIDPLLGKEPAWKRLPKALPVEGSEEEKQKEENESLRKANGQAVADGHGIALFASVTIGLIALATLVSSQSRR